MNLRLVLVPGALLALAVALGVSGLAGYRLGREAERAVYRASPAAALDEKADAASSIAADTGQAATVLVSGMRFQPEITRIKAGQSVAWIFNDAGLFHSVTAIGGDFHSGPKTEGAYVVRFDRPGTYCYLCKPHPGRNLCEQGARWDAGPMLLAANTLRAAGALLDRAGGGVMQGMVIVEE